MEMQALKEEENPFDLTMHLKATVSTHEPEEKTRLVSLPAFTS